MNKKLDQIKEGIKYLKKDPKIAPLIKKHGIWKPQPLNDLFHSLTCEIINQQLSDKASETITNKLTAYFNGKFPTPKEMLRTPDKDIRKVGISWAKVSYIKNAAKHIIINKLTITSLLSEPEEKVRSKLTKIKGVGPWTVDMVLIFTLVHLDILPAGDLGIKKAFQKLYNKPTITYEEMQKIAQPWRPYRSIASWYLWRSLEN